MRQFEGLKIKGRGVSRIDWEKELPHPQRDMDSLEIHPKRIKEGEPRLSMSQVVLVVPGEKTQLERGLQNSQPDHDSQNHSPSTSSITVQAPHSKKSDSRTKSALSKSLESTNLLTWQEHEITGHRKEDPDDDGEGLNGVGFIPTTAIAYARAEKRRQQIQEYRNREAKEARRIRSERRRGEKLEESAASSQKEDRRVRFTGVKDG